MSYTVLFFGMLTQDVLKTTYSFIARGVNNPESGLSLCEWLLLLPGQDQIHWVSRVNLTKNGLLRFVPRSHLRRCSEFPVGVAANLYIRIAVEMPTKTIAMISWMFAGMVDGNNCTRETTT